MLWYQNMSRTTEDGPQQQDISFQDTILVSFWGHLRKHSAAIETERVSLSQGKNLFYLVSPE